MTRLLFVPKAHAHPRFPNKGPGDMPYVGRRFVKAPEPGRANGLGSYEATEEPASVVAGSPEANRLIELCKRDGDVLPADAATAKAIGVPFVPLTYHRTEREWFPSVAATSEPKAEAPPKRMTSSRKADE